MGSSLDTLRGVVARRHNPTLAKINRCPLRDRQPHTPKRPGTLIVAAVKHIEQQIATNGYRPLRTLEKLTASTDAGIVTLCGWRDGCLSGLAKIAFVAFTTTRSNGGHIREQGNGRRTATNCYRRNIRSQAGRFRAPASGRLRNGRAEMKRCAPISGNANRRKESRKV
jgi:hypothetical protein